MIPWSHLYQHIYSQPICQEILPVLFSQYNQSLPLLTSCHEQLWCELLVNSHLDYCSNSQCLLCSSAPCDFNTAASMILVKHNSDHPTLLLRALPWFPLSLRVKTRFSSVSYFTTYHTPPVPHVPWHTDLAVPQMSQVSSQDGTLLLILSLLGTLFPHGGSNPGGDTLLEMLLAAPAPCASSSSSLMYTAIDTHLLFPFPARLSPHPLSQEAYLLLVNIYHPPPPTWI